MPKNLGLNISNTAVRDSVSKKQAKEIRALYKNVAKEIQKDLEKYKSLDTATGALQTMRLQQLQEQVAQMIEFTNKDVEKLIKHGMIEVSQGVCYEATKLAQDLGFGIKASYANVPNDVVRRLVTGKVYDNSWSLSESIWDMTKTTQKDLYKIVAAGVAENKSVYDIAKNLEEYVNPSKVKPWNLKMADGKRIYKRKIDYNAQRLARTLVQHSYQQSLLQVTKGNPWLRYYVWHSNGSRPCPLCQSRDGNHYHIDNIPMDHPNGMCIIEPEFKSDEEITDDLANWITSDYGEYPEIDSYAMELFGVDSIKELKGIKSADNSVPMFNPVQEKYLGKYGFTPSNMPKTFDEFSHKISHEDIAEILDGMGTSWLDPHPYQQLQKFYERELLGEKNNLVTATKKTKKVKTVKEPEVNKVESIIDDFKNAIWDNWLEKAKSTTVESMLEVEEAQFSKFSAKGVKGLKTYTGSAYREMNGYLRKIGTGMSAEEAAIDVSISESRLKAIKEAKKALESVGLDKDYVLRRGTDLGDLAGLIGGDFSTVKQKLEQAYHKADNISEFAKELNDKYSGVIGKMHGFTSTSSIYDRGFSGDVEMIFYAPKGTPASSIMKISQYGTGEGETLLNAGTTVKISKIEESDGHKGSKIRIFCEVLLDK